MEGECPTQGEATTPEGKGSMQGEGSTLENKSSMQGEGATLEEGEGEDKGEGCEGLIREEEFKEEGLMLEEECEEEDLMLEEGESEDEGEECEDEEDAGEEDGENDAMPEEDGSMQGEGLILEAGSMQSDIVELTSSMCIGASGSEGGDTNMGSILNLMADGLDFTLDRKDDIEQALLENLLASLLKEQRQLEAEAERLATAPSQP